MKEGLRTVLKVLRISIGILMMFFALFMLIITF